MAGYFARSIADKKTDKSNFLTAISIKEHYSKTGEAGDELKHKVALDTVRCGISPLTAECGEMGARFC